MEAFREAHGLKLLVAWLQGIHRKPHRVEAAKTALSLVSSVFHVPTVRLFHDANIPSMGDNGFVGKVSDPIAGNTRILMTLLKDDPIIFLGQLLGPACEISRLLWDFIPCVQRAEAKALIIPEYCQPETWLRYEPWETLS